MGELPPHPLGGDYSTGPWKRTGAVGEGGLAYSDDTLRGALQPRWRTGSPWLLDHCDEEAGREEQCSSTFDLQTKMEDWKSWFLDHCDEEAGREEQCSSTFDLQWCVSSVVHAIKSSVCFILLHFLPNGAFSRNVGKLFSKLKLVTDNLLFIYAAAKWESTERRV